MTEEVREFGNYGTRGSERESVRERGSERRKDRKRRETERELGLGRREGETDRVRETDNHQFLIFALGPLPKSG